MRPRDLVLLLLALACGALLAWIDARPSWDDSGILAGLLLLGSAAFGLAAPRHPWRWGLAVGAWIPARQLLTTRQPMALLILAIAMAGAYGGAFLRRATTTAGG